MNARENNVHWQWDLEVRFESQAADIVASNMADKRRRLGRLLSGSEVKNSDFVEARLQHFDECFVVCVRKVCLSSGGVCKRHHEAVREFVAVTFWTVVFTPFEGFDRIDL